MYKSRKKSDVLFAGIFVILAMWMILSVHCRAAEKNNDEKQSQIVRIGSFEDTFDYIDKNGVRRGYGYELLQALAGYTGWKFEYVKCDWSNCFDKLENGEIDVMGDISYTDERAQRMLFSDEAMGEEKYILYADLSNMNIGTSDFKFMDGKRVGVLMDTKPESMLTEWENKNGIHTEHVNVNNNDDVEKKLANHEIDAFVSLEESIWSEQGISSVTTIGKSGIYFTINKERSDIKTELDYAMRKLDQDSPFFKADLYKKYFTLDYSQVLTGEEKSWVEEHGNILIGFLSNDPAVFSMEEETGKLTGMLAEYVSYAKGCLGNQILEFNIHEYNDYDEMIQALQEHEIDMIFYAEGEEIPISAQVVSIVDVYDALTSERCYKKAFDHDTAIQMILDGQCGQFNPLLLKCLKELSLQLSKMSGKEMDDNKYSHEIQRLSNEILRDKSLPNQIYSQSLVKVMQEKIDFFKSNSGMNSIDYNAVSGQLTILNGKQQILCQRDDPKFNLFKEFGVIEEDVQYIRDLLHQTSVQNKEISVQIKATVENDSQMYKLKLHTLWSPMKKDVYIGIIGYFDTVKQKK